MTKPVWPADLDCRVPSNVGGMREDTERLTVEAAFGERATKLDLRQLALREDDARAYILKPLQDGMVRHKGGQTFKVTGVRTDCETGATLVDYDLHGRKHFGKALSFSQPLTRFVEAGRFTPVYKVERYETVAEAEERSGGY